MTDPESKNEPTPRKVVPARDAAVEAAWTMLASGEPLARLGLSPAKLARATTHVSDDAIAYHLANGGVINGLAARLRREMTETGKQNSGDYQLTSKLIPNFDGANLTEIARHARNALGTVLVLDRDDARNAERVWYALIAIADLPAQVVGEQAKVCARLQEAHDANQAPYELAYTTRSAR